MVNCWHREAVFGQLVPNQGYHDSLQFLHPLNSLFSLLLILRLAGFEFLIFLSHLLQSIRARKNRIHNNDRTILRCGGGQDDPVEFFVVFIGRKQLFGGRDRHVCKFGQLGAIDFFICNRIADEDKQQTNGSKTHGRTHTPSEASHWMTLILTHVVSSRTSDCVNRIRGKSDYKELVSIWYRPPS